MKGTPPRRRGFGPPFVWYVFHPLNVVALFFLHKIPQVGPQQSRPEALLEGSKSFQEGAFSGTFSFRHRRTVATAGRSYGGPSEKFVGVWGTNFQKLPPNFSEVVFMWKSPDATPFGATSSKKFASDRSCSRSPPCSACGSSLSYSSPHTFCTPPYHGPKLRLKWPFTEWETGPEQKSPKNGEENGKWPQARNGQKIASKNPGKMDLKMGNWG